MTADAGEQDGGVRRSGEQPAGEGGPASGAPTIWVLADDLIWASRLDHLVRGAGARPVLLRSAEALDDPPARGRSGVAAVVDLAARGYDARAAIRRISAQGVPVAAVGRHDDPEARRAARDAGAAVVYAYGALAGGAARGFETWVREVVMSRSGDGRPAGIPADRYGVRLAAARDALRSGDASALLVGVGADLRWLTGYEAMNLERLTLLVLPRDGDPVLVAPRLEAPRASLAPAVAAGLVPIVTWEETEDAVALVPGLVGSRTVVAGAPSGAAASRGRLLVSDRLWASFLIRLQAAFPGTPFGLASEVLRALRMAKDADEIALLRAAAHAADRVVLAIAAGSLVGRTEADVAREVRERLLDEGHEVAAFAIVGSGPNSASPHHEASERRIAAGEPVVLDIGGAYGGYGSDTTRTLWVSGEAGIGPDPAFLRLYEVLRRAQEAATAAVAPGVPAERVDRVGRDVIEQAGFGAAFNHRIGHGIGLEEHEDPYLVAGNAEPLRPGHAFSVEPGIYLEGRFGARIEDIVVCGETGPDVLNEVRRDLWTVRGV